MKREVLLKVEGPSTSEWHLYDLQGNEIERLVRVAFYVEPPVQVGGYYDQEMEVDGKLVTYSDGQPVVDYVEFTVVGLKE